MGVMASRRGMEGLVRGLRGMKWPPRQRLGVVTRLGTWKPASFPSNRIPAPPAGCLPCRAGEASLPGAGAGQDSACGLARLGDCPRLGQPAAGRGRSPASPSGQAGPVCQPCAAAGPGRGLGCRGDTSGGHLLGSDAHVLGAQHGAFWAVERGAPGGGDLFLGERGMRSDHTRTSVQVQGSGGDPLRRRAD